MQYELSAQHDLTHDEVPIQPLKLLPPNEKEQLVTRKPSRIKPLLTLCNVQILNTGPDFKVFFPTVICFVIFLQAVTYLVWSSKTISKNIKDTTFALNLLQNISYILCGLVNPGVATTNERQTSIDQQLYLCKVCRLYSRPTTHHCSDCNACIKGYDHHCPWVGKCIGKNNFLLFCIFVFTTMVAIIYNFIALIMVAGHADD